MNNAVKLNLEADMAYILRKVLQLQLKSSNQFKDL